MSVRNISTFRKIKTLINYIAYAKLKNDKTIL